MLRRLILMLSIFVIFSCQDVVPPTELSLHLKVVFQDLPKEWIDRGQVKVTLTDQMGQMLHLHQHAYQEEVAGLSWELDSNLFGAWSIKLSFDHTVLQQENAQDQLVLQLDLASHPALDRVKQVLLYEEFDPNRHRVEIHLQALSFLKTSLHNHISQGMFNRVEIEQENKIGMGLISVEPWVNSLGLNDQLWWWYSDPTLDDEQVDALILNKQEAQGILHRAWLSLSQDSQWANALFDAQQSLWQNLEQLEPNWKPWLLVTLLNKQAANAIIHEEGQVQDSTVDTSFIPLTWGQLFYDTLLIELNGQQLSTLSLNILARVSCAPWLRKSEARTDCESAFQGIYIEKPEQIQNVDQQPTTNTSIALGSLQAHFTSRIISLDGSSLEDSKLSIIDPWGEHLTSSLLRLNHEVWNSELHSRDEIYPEFELDHLPILVSHFDLATDRLNRPQFIVELHASNQVGKEIEKQFIVEYEAPLRAKVNGVATLLEPLNDSGSMAGLVTAIPLTETLSSPLYESRWTAQISPTGRFELSVNGYHGPLWLEVDLLNGQQLLLISDMASNSEINYVNVAISPLSTFYTWLSLFFFTEQTAEINHQIAQVQSLADIYAYIDQQERWLSTYQTVQNITDFARRVSIQELNQLRFEQIETLAKAQQLGTQCTLSLINFDLDRVEELSQLWLLNSEALAKQIYSIAPVGETLASDSNNQWQANSWLEHALELWRSFMISACLAQNLFEVDEGHQASAGSPIESGFSYTSFGLGLTLNHGVWLHNGRSWLMTHDEEMKLSIQSKRGLVSVLVDSLGGNLNLNLSLFEPDESPRIFSCPWQWIQNEQDAIRTSSLQAWGEGEWQVVDATLVNEFFPFDQDIERLSSKAWRWSAGNEFSSGFPLPLTCQLNLSWLNTSFNGNRDDQQFVFELNVELWNLSSKSSDLEGATVNPSHTELVERELVFEVKSSAPQLRFNLSSMIITAESNEEASSENSLGTERNQSTAWKVYQKPNHPHWIFDHSEFIDQQAKYSRLQIKLDASRAVQCESSQDLLDLDYANRLGDYQLASPLNNNQSRRTAESTIDLDFHELSPRSPLGTWPRWARQNGGTIHQSEFKGTEHYLLDIKLADNLNGHKNIFVRCEDALGNSLIQTLSFTVDQQAPHITEARLKGINEVLLSADPVSDLEQRDHAHVQRDIDLLAVEANQVIHWGRWLTHWRDCPHRCPHQELNQLNLEFRAQDHEWEAHELKARIEADLYLLDEEEARVNETQLSSDVLDIDRDGLAQFNLYSLFDRIEWAQLPPSQGQQFWIELDLVISDPSGRESRLTFTLTIDSITPMISVQVEANISPIHSLINQGELQPGLNGHYGRLNIINPHDIPIQVQINPPEVDLDFELSTRESGLPILSSRLFQSCLYNESFQVSHDQRLINYQLRADQSIFGDCIPLSPPIASEQHFHYEANEWHQTPSDELNFILGAQSQRTVILPGFSPELTETLNQLIYSPNVLPSEVYPSAYQFKTFAESSIFASMDSFCVDCPTQLLLGHRIVMLDSLVYAPRPSENVIDFSQLLNTRYDSEFSVQNWSIFVGDDHGTGYGPIVPLFLTQTAACRFD